MNYIDTHFHLDLFDDINLIDEIEKNNVYSIAATNLPSVFDHTYKLALNKKYVRAALGYHPELVYQHQDEIDLFVNNLTKTRYIGEIGLDFSGKTESDKKIQIIVLNRILEECANIGNKILTLHSRGAQKEVIDCIGNNFPGIVILHWYSGSFKELERALKAGFFFSINIAMLNSEQGRKIISYIPIEKLLTESDGPFIKNNNKIASPLEISYTVEKLADFIRVEKEILKSTVYNNFNSILRRE
jgi:TatD DNase family protein